MGGRLWLAANAADGPSAVRLTAARFETSTPHQTQMFHHLGDADHLDLFGEVMFVRFHVQAGNSLCGFNKPRPSRRVGDMSVVRSVTLKSRALR